MRIVLITMAVAALAAIPGKAADVNAGKAAYNKACKSCHGADGTPNAAIAKMMKVEMKDLKSAEVQSISDPDMKKVITDGKGKMRPIKTLSGAETDDVIAFVKTLK